jgi:hypothetical protein
METGTQRFPKMAAGKMASLSLQRTLLLLSIYCIAVMKRDDHVANINLLDVERIRHVDLTIMNKATAQ